MWRTARRYQSLYLLPLDATLRGTFCGFHRVMVPTNNCLLPGMRKVTSLRVGGTLEAVWPIKVVAEWGEFGSNQADNQSVPAVNSPRRLELRANKIFFPFFFLLHEVELESECRAVHEPATRTHTTKINYNSWPPHWPTWKHKSLEGELCEFLKSAVNSVCSVGFVVLGTQSKPLFFGCHCLKNVLL